MSDKDKDAETQPAEVKPAVNKLVSLKELVAARMARETRRLKGTRNQE